jgi:hypothetical protein
MVVDKTKIDDDNKCTSFAGHFYGIAGARMKCVMHLPIDQVQGFTGSHGTLSSSKYLSCIALYAQAGAVVIGFGKMILLQDVKIGSQIFGPYCVQIDDGLFKMSRG